ncbi:unnamed protein product [Protopolystoma xenopodis]|uniref:Uncharacterized protein n=1 Tax=Protopolystoma xenopodis TaxID=117903 RepID=A0A3S5BJY1_9PLAT|nr:unnamed protein product [Protopolystoma xenopodis]
MAPKPFQKLSRRGIAQSLRLAEAGSWPRANATSAGTRQLEQMCHTVHIHFGRQKRNTARVQVLVEASEWTNGLLGWCVSSGIHKHPPSMTASIGIRHTGCQHRVSVRLCHEPATRLLALSYRKCISPFVCPHVESVKMGLAPVLSHTTCPRLKPENPRAPAAMAGLRFFTPPPGTAGMRILVLQSGGNSVAASLFVR